MLTRPPDAKSVPPAFANYNGTILLGAITNYTNSKGEKVVSENLDWREHLCLPSLVEPG
jgi:hypothetical protein